MNNKVVRRTAVSVRFRSLLLVVGFVSLGYLTACSQMQHEVIAAKQATAEARAQTSSRGANSHADQSLWSTNR